MCQECGIKPCKRGAKKYCSRECSLKNTAVLKMYGNFWKGKRMPNYVRQKISHSTLGRPSNDGSFRKGHAINLGRKRWDIGEKSGAWRGRTSKICKVCKKEMLLPPWDIKRKFCGRACWALGTRGKGSPVYKGSKGIARLRDRIAQMPEYRQWHAAILKRDKYKCTNCGAKHSKKTPLEVDHIKRFLHIAEMNKIFTPEDARKCKELWDTSNGRTLCKPCHRASDTYGTKGLSKIHKPQNQYDHQKPNNRASRRSGTRYRRIRVSKSTKRRSIRLCIKLY